MSDGRNYFHRQSLKRCGFRRSWIIFVWIKCVWPWANQTKYFCLIFYLIYVEVYCKQIPCLSTPRIQTSPQTFFRSLKGLCHGDFAFWGLNCSEISERQLYPWKTLSLNINGRCNLYLGWKSNFGYKYRFFCRRAETTWEHWLTFSNCNPFPSESFAAKRAFKQFWNIIFRFPTTQM